MTDTKWYAIEDLYTIEKYKIKHNKNPKTKWIRLPCVYKIKQSSRLDVPILVRSTVARKRSEKPLLIF